MNLPLTILRCDNPAVSALYKHKLTLIRPDQHIAWVGDLWPASNLFNVFAMATGQCIKDPFNADNKETVYESNP
jgi:hypothetical protein